MKLQTLDAQTTPLPKSTVHPDPHGPSTNARIGVLTSALIRSMPWIQRSSRKNSNRGPQPARHFAPDSRRNPSRIREPIHASQALEVEFSVSELGFGRMEPKFSERLCRRLAASFGLVRPCAASSVRSEAENTNPELGIQEANGQEPKTPFLLGGAEFVPHSATRCQTIAVESAPRRASITRRRASAGLGCQRPYE